MSTVNVRGMGGKNIEDEGKRGNMDNKSEKKNGEG